MRRVAILGSTGSIGVQALDVIDRSGEHVLAGLSASTDWRTLVDQARAAGVSRIALVDEDAAVQARAEFEGEVLSGPAGLVELVVDSGADLILNAIVGSAGLGPTVAALGEGIDLALANKESLVVGGELVMQLAQATGARVLPVDSEHSALHQLIDGERPGTIEKLVLTASGGPFRGRTRERASRRERRGRAAPSDMGDGRQDHDRLRDADEQGARGDRGAPPVRHAYERIDVVVHPQSIVHSYVLLCDGAALAHLGHPDMRVPIAYALHHPERVDVPVKALDLAEVGSLTFEPVDTDAFPCLRLAREAAVAGGTAPCILNAANEVAVHAFLDGRLPFLGIPAVIEETLERLPAVPVRAFDSLYEADRACARGRLGGDRRARLSRAPRLIAALRQVARGAPFPPLKWSVAARVMAAQVGVALRVATERSIT